MSDPVPQVQQAIQVAAGQYHRLVVLAGVPGSGKTHALQTVGLELGAELVNVNLELSKRMLDLTRTQRGRQVERLFKDVVAAKSGEIVLLDNLEILFDGSLDLEPFRLLQVVSRNRTIVASWNGTYSDDTLTYAEPGHPEFVQFKKPEAVVIAIDADATL